MIGNISPLVMTYNDYIQGNESTINLIPKYRMFMYWYIFLRIIFIICFEISLKQLIYIVMYLYYYNEDLSDYPLNQAFGGELAITKQKNKFRIKNSESDWKNNLEILEEVKKTFLIVIIFFAFTLFLQSKLAKYRLQLKQQIGISVNDLFMKNLKKYNIYLLEKTQFNKISHMYFLIEESMIIYIDSYAGILYSIFVFAILLILISKEIYLIHTLDKIAKKQLIITAKRNLFSFMFIFTFYMIGICIERFMYCKYDNYFELFEEMYFHKVLKILHIIPKFIRETIMFIIIPAVIKTLFNISNIWEKIMDALLNGNETPGIWLMIGKMFALIFMSVVFAFLIGGIRSKGGDVFLALFLENRKIILLCLEQCLPPVYKNVYKDTINGQFTKINININRKIKEVDFNINNLEFKPGINFLNGDTNKIKILLELISGMTTHELLPGEVYVTYINENGEEQTKDLSMINDKSISKNVLHIPFSVNIPDTVNIMKFLSMFNKNRISIEEVAYCSCLFPQVRRDQQCAELSGGQKARVKITLMALYRNNLKYNFNVEIWETLEVGLDYKLKQEMYVPQILNNPDNRQKIKIVVSAKLIQDLIQDKLKTSKQNEQVYENTI